jgi:hypothetical protein
MDSDTHTSPTEKVFVCVLFLSTRPSAPSVIGPVFSKESAALEWAEAKTRLDGENTWRVLRRSLDPSNDASIFADEASPYSFHTKDSSK